MSRPIDNKLVSKRMILGASTLATALTTTVLPIAAIAAENNGPDEEVVVIGSRVAPRSISDSPVPVDVFSQDDLLKSGSLNGELSALLHSLAPSFNFPRQSNSDTADLVRPAQLRGLSPDQTLVLVNGKRRHTTAILNTSGKVGRGSAPVDLNTIPFSAIKRIEVLRDGAAAQYGSDAIAGVINIILKDSDEGGTVNVSYGAHKTEFAPTNDDITDGETLLISGNTGFALGDGFLHLSGQYRDRNATNRAGFDQVPFFENDAGNVDVVGNLNYKVGDPDEDGYSLFANYEQALAGDKTVYAFGSRSSREASGSNFFRYPNADNNVKAIYPNGFLPRNVGTATDNSLVVGVKGGSEWKWDLSFNYGASEFELDVKNSVNASLGANSPTSFSVGNFDYDQILLNADVTRSIELGSIPTAIAFGAEYRSENYETSAGSAASYALGADNTVPPGSQGIQGLRPEDEVNTDRDSFSLYADAEFELSDRFLVGTAARYEDYSDFGDTFNTKLTARFNITDEIALRAAASTGFRAPALVQTGYQATSTNFGAGGALSTFILLPAADPLAAALGAQKLDAEESVNLSIGVSANFDNGLSITLDLYQVDIDDRITLSEGIFADANGNAVSGLPQAAAHPGIQGAQFFRNQVDTETKGFDLVINYTWTDFDFSLGYNKTETDITNNGLTSLEEINSLETAAPEDKLILTVNWAQGNWSAMARATQFGETQRVFDFGGGFVPTQTYGKDVSVDVDVAYDFDNGFSVALGANNLLDEYPDFSIGDISYFGNFPFDIVQPIGVNGRYVYARTSYNF